MRNSHTKNIIEVSSLTSLHIPTTKYVTMNPAQKVHKKYF